MQEEEASPEPRKENGNRLSNILFYRRDNKAVGEADYEHFLNRFQELSAEHNGHIPLVPVVWDVFAERGIEREEARRVLWHMEQAGLIRLEWMRSIQVLPGNACAAIEG